MHRVISLTRDFLFAQPFIESARSQLIAISAQSQINGSAWAMPANLNLFGGFVGNYDTQTLLTSLFPTEVGVTVGVVLLLVFLSFGSVLLALRLLFTIFISLCWTAGLCALVYMPGAAQRAFAVLTPSVLNSTGIFFVIPPMAFSILVGLALDYGMNRRLSSRWLYEISHCFLRADIFLMARVIEFRELGWSDRASVALAVRVHAFLNNVRRSHSHSCFTVPRWRRVIASLRQQG